MTNSPIALKAPLNFNREDPFPFSLVECGVLYTLSFERYNFQPTASRELYGL